MGFFAQLEKYAASHHWRPGSAPEYAPRGRNDFKARGAPHIEPQPTTPKPRTSKRPVRVTALSFPV